MGKGGQFLIQTLMPRLVLSLRYLLYLSLQSAALSLSAGWALDFARKSSLGTGEAGFPGL